MIYPRRQRSSLATVELLTTDEVCRRYGFKERTVQHWAEAGLVPAFKTPGGQWRYPANAFGKALVKAVAARRRVLGA